MPPAMTDVIDRIAEQRVLPVLRCADVDDAVATARACARAGMSVVELTCSTPGVVGALEALRDDGLLLGLGTVTDSEQIADAARAGARFVVSFTAPPRFVFSARAFGLASIPGALTPSEVARCHDAGASAVKLFPARTLVPGYVGDLRAVMPGLRLMATGGLSAATARPWLDAGALAVGLGSELGTVASHGADEVQRRARAALRKARA